MTYQILLHDKNGAHLIFDIGKTFPWDYLYKPRNTPIILYYFKQFKYPQFTRNYTPQNDNFFIFRVILNQHTPRYAFFVCLENEEILSV